MALTAELGEHTQKNSKTPSERNLRCWKEALCAATAWMAIGAWGGIRIVTYGIEDREHRLLTGGLGS